VLYYHLTMYRAYSVFGRKFRSWYSAGLRAGWSGVRVPAGAGNFSLHHLVQTGSGAHPAFYQMCTGALSLGIKRPGREADHSPPSSAEVKEWVELYLHSPNTPSWRGAHLQHRDNFTFYSGRGVQLTTHFHIAPRLIMRGDIPPLPDKSSWRGA
jgi:hypothetical protein